MFQAFLPTIGIFLGILAFAHLVGHPYRDRNKQLPAWVWYHKDMSPLNPDDDTSPRGYWVETWDETNPPVYHSDLAHPASAAA